MSTLISGHDAYQEFAGFRRGIWQKRAAPMDEVVSITLGDGETLGNGEQYAPGQKRRVGKNESNIQPGEGNYHREAIMG
jgi:hypothetical protein